MARSRAFDVDTAITTAGEVFARLGYSATSIDDLVTALGLHRGSLYQAFGSKRGLFLAALRRSIEADLPQADWSHVGIETPQLIDTPVLDLVLMAALELAPTDEEVRDLVATACTGLEQRLTLHGGPPPAELLGQRLLRRAQLTTVTFPT